MSIRMSMIGLVSSTVVAALVAAGGCGGDKKTEATGDAGSGSDVGGASTSGGSGTTTSAGGATASTNGGATASTNGGSTATGGAATSSTYATAGNGAYVCRKGAVATPAIAPGKNGVWGGATDVTGGMFAPYTGTDMTALVTSTTATAGSVVVTADMKPGWYSGFGLYMKDPEKCFDASSYTGIRVTIGGTAGVSMIYLQVQINDNYPIQSANNKGACVGDWSTCTNNQFKLPALSATPTAIDVPFTSIIGGLPKTTLDPSQILGVQWQVNCPSGDNTANCPVNVTIGAVTFY